MAKAKTAENAKLQIESGQTLIAMAAMTDSGDQTVFTNAAEIWSEASGKEPVVVPDGILTGDNNITPDTVNDQVDIAAMTYNRAGTENVSVAASPGETVTRGSGGTPVLISSITINSSDAIAVVAGTQGAGIVETRGAAGGPPHIPVGSIEVGQVRLTSITAGLVLASEIFEVDNQHRDGALFPDFEETNANADGNANVTFLTALQANHTGDIAKGVFSEVNEPIFQDISLASDFVPSANSHSTSSTQIYQNIAIGTRATSITAGSFTSFGKDIVNNLIQRLADEIAWVKFFPNKLKTGFILDQGKLGVAETYPADDSISFACTIAPTEVSIRKTS